MTTDTTRGALQSQRRAARRAESQTAILDAAERVFSEDGLRTGSLRRIADLSGYSTAAIYKFFDSKQHLVAETLNRRGDEYLAELSQAADATGSALERLHRIVDAAAAFFGTCGYFSPKYVASSRLCTSSRRRLFRHVCTGERRSWPAFTSATTSRLSPSLNDTTLPVFSRMLSAMCVNSPTPRKAVWSLAKLLNASPIAA